MQPTTPERTRSPRRRDRRHARHEATTQEILAAAWAIARDQGVAGFSLRAVARAVDMEPPSLYTYFASKNALLDRMFTQGNRELLDRVRQLQGPRDLEGRLRAAARMFMDFCTEDQARYQLLFTRAIPEFEPSPESYAIAVEVITTVRSLLAEAGLRRDADFDLWTSLTAGLAAQQLANDPGGDRYSHLLDAAVAMFAAYVRTQDGQA